MKVEIGVIVMIVALAAFADFVARNQCNAPPSTLYCQVMSATGVRR